MPRARCPESIDAEKRYKAGEKLVDIARSIKKPEGTVRRWKSDQNWDGDKGAQSKKKQTERSDTKPNARIPPDPATHAPPSVEQQMAASIEANDELTPQQKDFCRYYTQTWNATQAYFKSHNCTYATANTEGPACLVNPRIKAELRRLREIRAAALEEPRGEDVVALHMRIAFADITDFVEFKAKAIPVVHKGEPVMMENPKNPGQFIPVTERVNVIHLKDSANVDGQLITEISEGREGSKVKLADRQRSLAFLERYFQLNPMDRHKADFDNKRHELELLRVEIAQQVPGGDDDSSSSNFLEAMTAVAGEVWGKDGGDDPGDAE